MSNSLLVLVAVLSCVYLVLFLVWIRIFIQGKTQEIQRAQIIFATLIAFIVLFSAIFGPFLYQYIGQKTDTLHQTKYFMYFVFGATLIIALLALAVKWIAAPKSEFFTTKNITRLAIFTALSFVLYFFVKFNVPFIFPQFLEIQFSDMPALLAGFMMGPQAGAIVIVLKVLLKLPFSSTGGVGELADLILGLVYVMSASLIYRRLRTKKGALLALIVSSVLCIFTAVAVNRYIIIPFYTTFMLPWEALLGMVSHLYSGITKATFYNYYLWLAVLPFNAIRCLIVVLITFFMYKPTKRIFGFVEKSVQNKLKSKTKKV